MIRSIGLLVGGVVVLALASRLAVPMTPVPITAQTLAVTVIGAFYGWRLGTVTVLTWLGLAALGAPLLAEGASGVTRFTGPGGGYLMAFPIAAAVTGWLGERGWNDRFAPALGEMTIGNAICLAVGSMWLGWQLGAETVLANGVLPFLPGAAIKSLLGAALVRAWSARTAVRG